MLWQGDPEIEEQHRASAADSEHAQTMSGSRARQYVVLACSTSVALTFGMHAVAPALPLVQEVLGLSAFEVGLVTSVYILPGVLFAVPLGMCADLLGRRPVFAVAAVLYGVMGVAQGLAPTFEWLLAWRLGQGVAFAALMPLTVTLIGDALTGLAQVRGQTHRQVSMAAADMVVPIIGAQLAAIAWFLPFTAQGVVILPGLVGLFVLSAGRSYDTPRRGYIRRALNSARRRGFPSVLVLGFARFFARFSIIAFLPLQLDHEIGASLTAVGIVMGITMGLGFLSAMFTARLSGLVRPSRIVLVALTASGCAVVGLAMPINLVTVVVVGVVYALADGVLAVLQSSYAARGSPDDVRAGLVAVNGTARNAGKFVAPLAVGAVASLTSVTTGLLMVGILVVLSAVPLTRGLATFDGLLRDPDAKVAEH